MELYTERLLVRDFTMDDLDALLAIFGDEEVMRFVEPPYTREKAETFLRTFCVERVPHGAFAAVERESGQLIGYLLFKSVDDPKIYEMGWIFRRDCWRRGYAAESCRALITYGFEELDLHKLCAETDDPIKSLGLMKKLGMKPEGVQRMHSHQPDGSWKDLYWCGILESDYFAALQNGGPPQSE